MAISAIMTLNIVKYVQKTLNLKIIVHLYQKFLYCLNITYTVALITSSGFENPNFLIFAKIDSNGSIEKTMIFFDSDKKSIALKIHLQTLLLDNLKNKRDDIIKSFLLILKVKININWLKAFYNSNIKIIICMDTVRIRVNIPDKKHIIQETIIDNSFFTTVF